MNTLKLNQVPISNPNLILPSLDKIVEKDVSRLTFKDVLCLIFHAAGIIDNQPDHQDYNSWSLIYHQFLEELIVQRIQQWPNIKVLRNNQLKRIEIVSMSKSFIISTNIYMLLYRLLYIESYKKPYNLKSRKFHKVLNCRYGSIVEDDNSKDKNNIEDLSLSDLFSILNDFIKYYLRIYHDETFEYVLGKTILDQIV